MNKPDKNSLRSINLNLFKVFAAIYSQRNLTHAGEQLTMTQPTVSRALERLNLIFNERLFVRIDGEMRPTRTAEMIAPFILEGLAMLESAADMAGDLAPLHLSTTFKIGLNDYSMAIVLPSLIRRVKKLAPAVFISTSQTNYLDAPSQLARYEIDCAIVSSLSDRSRLAVEPLFREDYVVISALDHPDLPATMSLDTYLSAEHLLVSYVSSRSGWVDDTLAAMGKTRKVAGSVHDFSAAPQILLSQPYLCTLPRRLALQFARSYPIRVDELPFESKVHVFHFIRAFQVTTNPLSNWFRDQVVATCQELVQAGQPGLAIPSALLPAGPTPAEDAR